MTRSALLVALLTVPALLGAQDAPKTQSVDATKSPTTVLPLKHDAKPTSAAISVEDLMTRLYIFADDSMMGREAGKRGSVMATEYLAAEAKRIGLKPAGDNGTYFQTLPVKMRTIDPMSSVIVGGANLTLGKDFTILGTATVNKADVDVVYGGTYGDTVHTLTAEQANGRFVLMTVPLSNGAINAVVGDERELVPSSAAGMALLLPSMVMPQLHSFFGRPDITVVDGPLKSRLFLNAGVLSQLFAKPLSDLKVGDVGTKLSLNVVIDLKDNEFPVRNVVGILPGSDPVMKNQYVAVGAHSDHIGISRRPAEHDSMLVFNRIVRPGGAEDGGKQPTAEQITLINGELAELRKTMPARADSINNGADDDGSGSVSVQEIAEYLSSLKVKPKRSTLFVWHVGEEKGLWGSHFFTEHSTVPRDSIVAQLNIDMVGRGAATDEAGKTKDGKSIAGGPDYLQVIGSRRLSTELGDLVERVNTNKQHKFQFDYSMDADGHPMNIYCRSDHYEYAKFGIPVAFFTTGGHSAYHQLTDEPQYIDYPHMTRVAKLVSDVALEVGNMAKRPLVNMPKMDPKGVCKQ